MSAHGKHRRRRRVVHKNRRAAEEHAVLRPPSWMDDETYGRLVRLRNEIQATRRSTQ